MNNDFKKEDFLPVYCEKCRQQGYIFSDNFDEPDFIVCSCCGSEMSQVWCPKCEMGGDFINELLKERPRSWVCSDCKTEYILPASFYEEPIHLYLEDELSPDVLMRVLPPNNNLHKLAVILMGIVGISEFILIYVFLNILRNYLIAGISFVVMIIILIILGRWDTKLLTKKREK